MNKPFGDGGKPIEYGDSSYIHDGIYNPIVWVGKMPYRPRVETLVIRDHNKVFLRMYDKLKGGLWYTLPGGSIDADSSKEEQARNETNEEALVEIKNLYYTGIQYYSRYSPGFVRSGGNSPIEYEGTINDVFVASYAGPFDKSKVEPKDLDPDIADNGKFYPIQSVMKKLLPEHIWALYNSPLVDATTKRDIGVFIANSYGMTESMNPDFPTVSPPEDFIYHGSMHRFDVFHPMSIDFGNAQQKPGWSTFAFGEIVMALRFGLMRTIQSVLSGKDFEKCQWNFKLNKPYIYRHQYRLIRPRILGLKFYVYTISTEGLDIGIGNDIRFPEYTFREDNVRPYAIQTFTIDDPLLDAHLECMDLITAGYYENEELPKFDYYKKRHHAAFINHDYENDPKIQKLLQAVSEKRLQPGDDIEQYMIDNDLVPDDSDWKVPTTESVGPVGERVITTKRLLEYKKKYPHSMIRHVRTPDDVNQGRSLENKSGLMVGYVMVDTKRHMITALEVEKAYRGLGFGKKLLDIATNELGAKYLTVNKKNTPAISLYKKYGWKVYKETDTMLFMSAPGVTFLMEGYQFQPSEVSAMVPVIESRLTAADKNNSLITYNMDKFVSGKTNICIITGLSGSGKSTLSREYGKKFHAEIIELDEFSRAFPKNPHPVIRQYFKENPDLNVSLRTRILDERLPVVFRKFFSYVLAYCRSHPEKKFVIEGVQIFYLYYNAPELLDISDTCIVIVNTPKMKSFIRMMERTRKSSIREYVQSLGRISEHMLAYDLDYELLQRFMITMYQTEMKTNPIVESNQSEFINVEESFVDIDEIAPIDGEKSYGVPEDKSTPGAIPESKKYIVNQYKHTGEYLGLLDWEKSIDDYIKKKNYGMGLYYVYGSNCGYPEYLGEIIVKDDKTWYPYTDKTSPVEESIFRKRPSLFTNALSYVNSDPKKVLQMICDELSSWDYGYVIKGRIKMFSNDGVAITDIQNDPYFVDNYRTLSLADFERHKCGTCFDYTYYIYNLIAQLFKIHDDYDIICYYIEGEDGNDHPCHVFPVIRLRSTNRFYWMETAWKPNAGLFEYKKKDELLKDFVKKWLKSNRLDDYAVLCEYVPSSHLVGIGCFKFMSTVNRNTNIEL